MTTKFFGTKVCMGLIGMALATQQVSAAIIDVTVGPGGSIVFSPADVSIQLGDTVRWTWDSNGHNVGYGLPGAADNSVFFSGAPANVPTTFEVLFDQAFVDLNPVPGNVYDYHCHPHGTFGMVGSVTVDVPPIPTVSQWGMMIMGLLVLTAGGVVIRRRVSVANS